MENHLIVGGVSLFMGICIGWFFKSWGNGIKAGCLFATFAFLGLVLFAQVFDAISSVNHWSITVPFTIGFLYHPIRSRMK